MASRAIKPKRDDTMLSGWESQPERAPSSVQQEQPGVARFLALIGLVLAALGLFAVLAPAFNKAYIIGSSTGVVFLSFGLMLLTYHALTDQDIQYRLMYLLVGYIGIGAGVALRILPLGGKVGGLFLAAGIPSLLFGLLFVLTAIRHETETRMRLTLSVPLGVLGFLMIVLGSVAGHLNAQFLQVEGVLISLVGLLFIAAFLGTQGAGSDIGFRAGLGLVGVGGLGLAAAIGHSYFGPPLFFVPSGLILICFSAVYLFVGLVVCTDWPVLVLYRREIKAFFFSPVGFLVLLGSVLLAWMWFWLFADFVRATVISPRSGGIPEPMVHGYLYNPVLILSLVFIVPVITMRLLSEEKRSGTLEVLLTAPLSEASLVLAKFLAALTMYLVAWLPWFGFLIALRLFGGTDFEFRPILSFLPVLILTGMAFLSLGLFCSSTTSNQIIAAVLTFVVMILQWLPFILKIFSPPDSIWRDVLTYISPLDLWRTSLFGILAPRFFVYYVSVTVFFLFLTMKVLESRRWK